MLNALLYKSITFRTLIVELGTLLQEYYTLLLTFQLLLLLPLKDAGVLSVVLLGAVEDCFFIQGTLLRKLLECG